MSAKNIVVIDNFDSFTFNLVDYFRQLGAQVKVFRNTIDPEIIADHHPDLIVLSPGPSVPKNAGNLMDIIDRYHSSVPVFGVCLGLQALIEYFGGSLKFVEPCHGRSHRIDHDGNTIFNDVEPHCLVGRYHSLVADSVPDCFEVTASLNDEHSGNLVMAIRHKTLAIEAVQFHPESVLSMKGGNGFKMISNVFHNGLAHAR